MAVFKPISIIYGYVPSLQVVIIIKDLPLIYQELSNRTYQKVAMSNTAIIDPVRDISNRNTMDSQYT